MPPVETVPIATAREWARKAFHDGKAAGYLEAVKSLEESAGTLYPQTNPHPIRARKTSDPTGVLP